MRRMLLASTVRVFMPRPDTIVSFVRAGAVRWDVHIGIRKGADRKHSVESARAAARWMIEHEDCRKLTAFIPANNRAAVIFARRCGMVEEGWLKGAHLQGGKLHDVVVFGSTKERIQKLFTEGD